MGNKQKSSNDKGIANNPINYYPIPNNPPNDFIQSGFSTDQNLKEKSFVEPYKRLNHEILKLNDKQDIIREFRAYTEETILDFYEHCSCAIFRKNNDLAKLLATLIPKNERDLINVFYVNQIPIGLLLLMKDKINFNYQDKDKRTFIFRIYNIYQLDYVMEMIKIIDVIDINTIGFYEDTFVFALLKQRLEIPTKKAQELFTLLEEKKYIFNHKSLTDKSLLTYILTYYQNDVEHWSEIISVEEYNIAIDCEWLVIMMNSHYNDIHNYIWYIFQRNDYQRLLYDIYNCDFPHVWGIEFVKFLKRCEQISAQKTHDSLNYHDKNGNTIIHSMAIKYDKILLNHTLNHFKQYIKLLPNKEGKMPDELLKNAKLEFKLKV
jgi:hypothetical protein